MKTIIKSALIALSIIAFASCEGYQFSGTTPNGVEVMHNDSGVIILVPSGNK